MRVTCSQEDLGPALHALSRITRNEFFPLYRSVLFTATRAASNGDQGTLTLMGMGMYGMGGMITDLPAIVEQEGQTLVPIEPLAEYVEGLRPGRLLLSQEREDVQVAVTEEHVSPALSALLDAATLAHPFQIESAYTSDAGTVSTNQAKLATWEGWEPYLRPSIQQWLATKVSGPVLQAASFKEAIACCVPFANKRIPCKDGASEMYGVLLRIDADSLELTATKGTMLVSRRLLLERSASFSFAGLFPANALSWMKEELPDGEMTLAWASDERTHKPVLLISVGHMTWFCRSMDAPFPCTWVSTLSLSHEAELRIRRKDLMRPLKFFAGSAAEISQALALLIQGTTLWMYPFAIKDEMMQDQREIPLVDASTELSILINPKQFKQLVSSVQDDVLQLQVGYFERQEGQTGKRIGFLRLCSEQTTMMMSLSRSEPLPPSSSPAPTLSQKAASTEKDLARLMLAQEV